MDFENAKNYIVERLAKQTSSDLTYHNVSHTLDVYQAVNILAEKEGVSGHNLLLLQTAAIYHDSGMLVTYKGHEEASIVLIREILPGFGYAVHDIETIGNIIITTRLPQTAKTQLEKILCDADLDYLGRDDFFTISHSLRLEWQRLGLEQSSLLEWYKSQVVFLSEHCYFTNTAIENREPGKRKNLNLIKQLLNHNE